MLILAGDPPAEAPDGDGPASAGSLGFSAGDLVWGKQRGQPWWPAMVVGVEAAAASLTPSKRKGSPEEEGFVMASYFGSRGEATAAVRCRGSQLRPFLGADADELAAQSSAQDFVRAVGGATAVVVRKLEGELSCRCCAPGVAIHDPAAKVPVSNFQPLELLDCLRGVAVDVGVAGIVDRVRMMSWVSAFEKGCNARVDPRRTMEELVEDFEDEEPWSPEAANTSDEEILRGGRKKRSMAELLEMGNKDLTENGDANVIAEDNVGADKSELGLQPDGGSSEWYIKRDRKKSKYLSSPYTHIVGSPLTPITKQPMDIKDTSLASDEDAGEKKTGTITYEAAPVVDMLTTLRCTALDVLFLKRRRVAKALKDLLAIYRSSNFSEGSGHKEYAKHVCQAVYVANTRKIDEKASSKRKRQKDDSGSGSGTMNLTAKRQKEMNKVDALVKFPVQPVVIGQLYPVDIRRANAVAVDPMSMDVARIMGNGKSHADLVSGCSLNAKQMQCGQSTNNGNKDGVKEIFMNINSVMPCSLNKCKEKAKTVVYDFQTPINKVSQIMDFSARSKPPPMDGRISANSAESTPISTEGALYRTLVNTSSANGSLGKKNSGKGGSIGSLELPSLNKKHFGGLRLVNSLKARVNERVLFSNPAALLIDFHRGVVVPSKDEVLEAFGRYGKLIVSQTEVHEATHSARVVFEKSSEAEAAYNDSEKLGVYGPPFATSRLHYMSPIKVADSPSPTPPPPPVVPQYVMPASKPMLTDMRKNLETMISSISASKTGTKVPLVEELQGLLAKVDMAMHRASSNSS